MIPGLPIAHSTAGAVGAAYDEEISVPGIYAADRLPLERLQQETPCIADGEDASASVVLT